MKNDESLSRRERQIMDIVYEMREATAQQILDRLPEPPSYSAVRALLRVLEQKGHLAHRQDGPRYIYAPRLAKDKARKSALAHLRQTFFDGSTTDIVATLLDLSEDDLSEDDFRKLAELIDKARTEGR
jgi:predicted transcriptional regulator